MIEAYLVKKWNLPYALPVPSQASTGGSSASPNNIYANGVQCVTAFQDGVQKLSAMAMPYTQPNLAPVLPVAGNSLRVGWSGSTASNGGDLFVGQVADVRVYSQPLSAAQAYALTVPTFANAVNPVPVPGQTSYTWTCAPGFVGAAVTMTRSAATNLWTSVGAVNCTVCPPGSYAGPSSCLQCPAGTYGAVAGLASAQCSGGCAPGYFCPAGSTSATAQPCANPAGLPGAGSAFYCPQGSVQPIAVSAGYYTTPLAVPEWLRSTQTACPPSRTCSGGLLFPAVDVSASCAAAQSFSTSLTGVMMNQLFGPQLQGAAPGWANYALNWTVTAKGVDTTCPASFYNFSAPSQTSNATTLFIGNQMITTSVCPSGFRFTITAGRVPPSAADALVSPYFLTLPTPPTPSCTLFASVINLFTAPTLVFVRNISVAERQPVSTIYGPVVLGASLDPRSTLVYSILSSTSSPNAGVQPPFSINCNGSLVATSLALAGLAQSYNLTVMIGNILNGQILSVTTWLIVTVTPNPVPPTLTFTAFSTYDQYISQPANAFGNTAGTLLGNVFAVDNNNVPGQPALTVSTAWSAVDSPNAFAISAAGAVTVAQNVLNALTKNTYNYQVNASDLYSWAVYNVTITLLASPRAPILLPQTLSVNDTATSGAVLSPALVATSTQQKVLTFTGLSPSTMFTVSAAGVVSVSAASLSWGVYTVTASVQDTSLMLTSAPVTVNVIQTNKAPIWTGGPFSRAVNEGTSSGSVFGLAVTATNPVANLQACSYSLGPATPQLWVNGAFFNPFTINPLTGQLAVAPMPAGMIMADRNATFATSFTYVMTLTATNAGSPPLSASTSLSVLVASIAPRLTPSSAAVAANATNGTVVISLSSVTWTAYSASTLSYSFANLTGVLTAEGVQAFNISGSSLVVAQTPAFNYNTKSAFTFNVVVFDSGTGDSTTAAMTVALKHVNRAPAFVNATFNFTAAERTLGSVGGPLMGAVADPDLLLSVGEMETFSITAGNDGTFGLLNSAGVCVAAAVSGATSQLCVLSTLQANFVYTVSPPTVYSLTVSVRDAGVDGPAYSASATFFVQIIPANTGPPVSDSPSTI